MVWANALPYIRTVRVRQNGDTRSGPDSALTILPYTRAPRHETAEAAHRADGRSSPVMPSVLSRQSRHECSGVAFDPARATRMEASREVFARGASHGRALPQRRRVDAVVAPRRPRADAARRRAEVPLHRAAAIGPVLGRT